MTDDHASLIERLNALADAAWYWDHDHIERKSEKCDKPEAKVYREAAEALSASDRALAEERDRGDVAEELLGRIARMVSSESEIGKLLSSVPRDPKASLAAARAAALEEAVERVRQTCFAMGLPPANALVFIHDLHALSPQAEPAWVNGRVRRRLMYVCQECGAVDDASAEAIQHQPHCSIQSPLRTPDGKGS